MLRDFTVSRGDVYLTILRTCPMLGPNVGNSVVTSMFKPIMIRVTGYDPLTQFVHEDDLVRLILTFLSQKKTGTFKENPQPVV